MDIAILLRLPLFIALLSIWDVVVSAHPLTGYAVNNTFHDGDVRLDKLPGLGQVVYRTEPAGRGTVGILVSCTATYIFCLWTSLHPKVLAGRSRFYRIVYKIIMTVYAVLAPEVFMICAFGEMRKAIKLHRAWNRKMEKDHPAESERDDLEQAKKKFGMRTAFFVVMGGFLINRSKLTSSNGTLQCIDRTPHHRPQSTVERGTNTTPLDDQHDRIGTQSHSPTVASRTRYTSWSTASNSKRNDTLHVETKEKSQTVRDGDYRTVLTPAGFLHYLDQGLINEDSFEESDMQDKGNTNLIGKLLAFAQALWLVIQSFARWQNSPPLPLTLLEVHVLIQVACAGFTYLCWWYKPLDVAEPIVVRLGHRDENASDQDVPQFGEAFMVHESFIKCKEMGEKNVLTTNESDTSTVSVWLEVLYDITTPANPNESNSQVHATFVWCIAAILLASVGGLHLAVLRATFPSKGEYIMWFTACGYRGLLPVICGPWFAIYYEDVFRTLWKMRFGAAKERGGVIFYVFSQLYKSCTDRATRAVMGVKETSTGTLEGVKETSTGTSERVKETSTGIIKGVKQTFTYTFWTTYQFIIHCTILNLVSIGFLLSLYLTVESYLALRSPPAGAFTTPRWSDWLPHV